MCFVRGARALPADALLVVDAEELQLQVLVQGAVHLGDLHQILEVVLAAVA